MKEDHAESEWFVRPTELGPLDRGLFAFAFELANSASWFRTPVDNPEQFGVSIVDEETDDVMALQFGDHPVSRALLTVKKHFPGDEAALYNFSIRFFAMLPILKGERVRQWMREDSESTKFSLLHHAVIFAGAQAPLDAEGEFNEDEFFSLVATIAATMDQDGG